MQNGANGIGPVEATPDDYAARVDGLRRKVKRPDLPEDYHNWDSNDTAAYTEYVFKLRAEIQERKKRVLQQKV